MNIKTHKLLVSQIPEDLKEGEEIEVSAEGIAWLKRVFLCWMDMGEFRHQPLVKTTDYFLWRYARRPAPAVKPEDVPINGCIPGDEVMTSQKRYRPWRLGDRIPAPLMVRKKIWKKGRWAYAQTAGPSDGVYLVPTSANGIDFETLLLHYEQHDGSPCGVEE